jgi:hypothetical protein
MSATLAVPGGACALPRVSATLAAAERLGMSGIEVDLFTTR